jgi:hypothetical protein
MIILVIIICLLILLLAYIYVSLNSKNDSLASALKIVREVKGIDSLNTVQLRSEQILDESIGGIPVSYNTVKYDEIDPTNCTLVAKDLKLDDDLEDVINSLYSFTDTNKKNNKSYEQNNISSGFTNLNVTSSNTKRNRSNTKNISYLTHMEDSYINLDNKLY